MEARNRWLGGSIALAFTITAGCAALAPSGNPEPVRHLTLHVTNRGWEDVTVFIGRGSANIRVGIVEGLSSRLFVLPTSITGTGLAMHLRGKKRISDEEFVSHVFDVSPGETASWVIEPLSSLSHVMIRR